VPNKFNFKESICHLCTKKVPKYEYGHKMYYSSFLQKYLPYFLLYQKKFPNKTATDIENELRTYFEYPKIGEKWISETILYKTVQLIFSPLNVEFHYRGKELKGLELDVWIPEVKLGIEYQGQQHYKAVSIWGGEEKLKEQRARDKQKKSICKSLGYTLVEFKYNEKISFEEVDKKIRKFKPLHL
jgi:hypothetical protein